MAIFCTQCGSGLPNSAKFCSNCGSNVQVSAPTPGRPLVRPLHGRQVAGVCLGLAQANGWDVAVIRILAVVALILTSGYAGIAYLAAWIGIPEENLQAVAQQPPPMPQSAQPAATTTL